MQEKAAGLLGYPGALPQARVERLMGDYFRHARGVVRWLEWIRRVAPVPVGPNLVRAADGVRFIDAAAAASQPDTWLSAFQAAIDCGTAVSDDTLDLHSAARGPLHRARFLSRSGPPGRVAASS